MRSARQLSVLAVLVAAIVTAAALGAGCEKPEQARVRNAIVITIDTLRRDHLGIYGYQPPTSPALDRFAASAAVFDDAVTVSPWTRASVAAMFTGLYPETLGLTCHNFDTPNAACDVLPAAAQTMAEVFSANGFATAGLIANIQIDELFGFAQGFDLYTDVTRDASDERSSWSEFDWENNSTQKLTDAALEWLASAREKPFFLYLHYLDPHEPYQPPPDYVRRFARESYDIGHPKAARLIPLYDAEIRSVDTHLDRLFGYLAASGLEQTTAVIVTSDHGEAFGEHAGHDWRHGHTLFEHQLRVPLIARVPGLSRAGSRIQGQVSLLDIAPTLFDALGTPAAQFTHGRTLTAALGGVALTEKGVLAGWGYKPIFAYRLPPWKLVWDRNTGTAALYELQSDPLELKSVASTHQAEANLLRHEGEQALAEAQRAAESFAADQRNVELNERQRERLRALGYIN